jgi:hypothetical protein
LGPSEVPVVIISIKKIDLTNGSRRVGEDTTEAAWSGELTVLVVAAAAPGVVALRSQPDGSVGS